MIGFHFFPHFGNLGNMSVGQITTPGTNPLFHNSSDPKLLMQSCVLAAKKTELFHSITHCRPQMLTSLWAVSLRWDIRPNHWLRWSVNTVGLWRGSAAHLHPRLSSVFFPLECLSRPSDWPDSLSVDSWSLETGPTRMQARWQIV